MRTLIKNVKMATSEGEVHADLVIANSNIQAIQSPLDRDESIFEHIIDGDDQLIIPGMIDVHIHGANNYDMMDGTTKSIQEVSQKCLQTGCTGFLVTSVTSSLEQLLCMIEAVKKVVGREQGAHILGIHLEGPYLNIEKKGMQDPRFIRHCNIDEMRLIFEHAEGLIKMVTIAPELPGADELIEYLKSKHVIVAAGHTNATYEEAVHAFKNGVTHITHCFNAMPHIHHRNPGITTAALEHDEVSVQAIVDHVHLHHGIVRLMHKIKTADRMVLITDALQAMGMADGSFQFGGHQVTVQDGIARLSDGTLASSTVTMNMALQTAVHMKIPLYETIKMATATPARILQQYHLGAIKEGYAADLVILDSGFQVKKVLLKGTLVYSQDCE
ncbi:N-acetylglucosamine-6-phosphate deacetylase [Paenibacillus sp. WLX1005]|uniref:N-acetylglucosamine-6-phosphate deacetylase n=1 Tax=Paenibacillus sp. WLX1005 TaxID=3243766 RepID=UPI0039845A5E